MVIRLLATILATLSMSSFLLQPSTPEASPAASPIATPVASPIASPVAMLSDDEEGIFASASVTEGDQVVRYVWEEDAAEASGFELQPVSMTFGNYDNGVWLFSEFINTSQQPLVTPLMLFDAQYNGTSFGVQYVHSPQFAVAPGESVFYHGLNIYSGAILYGDWTELSITFDPYTGLGDEYSTLDLRLELGEGRIYNDGGTDVDLLLLQAIGRDDNGDFAGFCGYESIGATIPAGLFVRLPDSISGQPVSSTLCSQVGVEFTQRLDTGPIVADTWIVYVPKP